MKHEKGSGETALRVWIGLVVWAVAAWITHVVVCLKTASWGFLIAGAIMFPVAVIHGTGAWFGVW